MVGAGALVLVAAGTVAAAVDGKVLAIVGNACNGEAV